MINIFDICSRVCRMAAPAEKFLWYENAGFENLRGRAAPVYREKGEIEADIRSVPGDGLIRSGGITQSPQRRVAYVSVTADGAPGSHCRFRSKGGDLMKRLSDGSLWLVTAEEEDFSHAGWRRLELVLQTGEPLLTDNPPDNPPDKPLPDNASGAARPGNSFDNVSGVARDNPAGDGSGEEAGAEGAP